MDMTTDSRMEKLLKAAKRRRLDMVLVCSQANVMALSGVNCDSAVLVLSPATGRVALYTDFRYASMVRRVAPSLPCRDIKRLRLSGRRIGYESSIPHLKYLAFEKKAPKAKFVDVTADIAPLRAVKTPDEIAKIRAAEKLACDIWNDATAKFKAGMTELEMARIIRRMAAERSEGESFSTIVCVGKNAAECHHEPDDTVWNGREPVLVDMGVRLDGVCSDLTRNYLPGTIPPNPAKPSKPSKLSKPPKPSKLYLRVYSLVLEANEAAIAAARPGMSVKALDNVARSIIRKGGFGKCFGHSLGHGVGYEVHEAPTVSRKGKMVLEPGMVLTIEPGIYLEGNLGVRIEDLVLITENGCEVLSSSAAK